MKTIHGLVKVANKTTIKELNRKLKKKGKLTPKDFETARYKEIKREDMPKGPTIIKRKW